MAARGVGGGPSPTQAPAPENDGSFLETMKRKLRDEEGAAAEPPAPAPAPAAAAAAEAPAPAKKRKTRLQRTPAAEHAPRSSGAAAPPGPRELITLDDDGGGADPEPVGYDDGGATLGEADEAKWERARQMGREAVSARLAERRRRADADSDPNFLRDSGGASDTGAAARAASDTGGAARAPSNTGADYAAAVDRAKTAARALSDRLGTGDDDAG